MIIYNIKDTKLNLVFSNSIFNQSFYSKFKKHIFVYNPFTVRIMRIEYDIELGFKDVMFKPKRSPFIRVVEQENWIYTK